MKKFRLWKVLLLMSTAIVSPTLAHADPITLTAIVASAAGVATTAATAGFGTLVAGLLGAAVSLAISFVGQLLFAPGLDAGAQHEGRTRKFDPHPTYRFAFGEFPQGGSVVFQAAEGKEYWAVYLLNSIPSETITKVEINDGIDLALLSDADNDVFDMTKGAKSDTSPWQNGIFQMWIGLGDHTQIPTEFTRELGAGGEDIADLLQSTDLWQGVTVAFIHLKYGHSKRAQRRWGHGSPPPLRFFGQWSKLYDPRLDSTSGVTGASGSHRIDDKTTWAYSANPALCGLMLATHDLALGFDQEMIPIQQWADAADACDVEDGAVGETTLLDVDWSTTVPVSYDGDNNGDIGGGYPGSGTWAVSRASVTIGAALIVPFGGAQVAKLTSTDTDGTLIESETARFGIYFDMKANARRGDAPYEFRYAGDIGGWVGQSNWRWKLFQADFDGDDVATTADIRAEAMMPYGANNITKIYDTSWQPFPGATADRTHEVTGDLVSFVFEGGRTLERFIEIGPNTEYFTTSLSALTRYRCDGLVFIDERELSMLDPVLVSMAGHLDTTGGMLGVRAGAWVAPTDTLSQPVGDAIEIRGARDAGFDTVRAKFIGRHREWELTDGQGYQLRAGARVHPLQLALVREPEQAARLEKIFALRAEPNRIVEAEWDGREGNRRIGERVNFALPGFARATSSYIVDSIQHVLVAAKDGFEVGVRMTLIEDLEATYNWSSADFSEGGDFTPLPPGIPSIDPPTSVVAAQSNFSGAGGATARLQVTITIDQELSEDAETLEVEIDDGGGFAHLVDLAVTESTLSYVTYVNPALVGVTYTARALAVSVALGDSTWTTSAPVTIVAPVLDYDPADYSAEYA